MKLHAALLVLSSSAVSASPSLRGVNSTSSPASSSWSTASWPAPDGELPPFAPSDRLSLVAYDEPTAKHALNLSQASYCISEGQPWSCKTCGPGITLTAVIEVGGGRALVGIDESTKSLFAAYRGSENIQNWLDNVRFLKTSPYSDYPDASVEKVRRALERETFVPACVIFIGVVFIGVVFVGVRTVADRVTTKLSRLQGFWSWYGDLKDGVNTALSAAAAASGYTTVALTGHSAGASVSTLHAFDMARGKSAPGLTLKQLINFGYAKQVLAHTCRLKDAQALELIGTTNHSPVPRARVILCAPVRSLVLAQVPANGQRRLLQRGRLRAWGRAGALAGDALPRHGAAHATVAARLPPHCLRGLLRRTQHHLQGLQRVGRGRLVLQQLRAGELHEHRRPLQLPKNAPVHRPLLRMLDI